MTTDKCVRYSKLPRPWQHLLRIFQSINHGRVEHIEIVNGSPVFVPYPTLVYEFKRGGDFAPRPEMELRDFQVGRDICELISVVSSIEKGVIRFIEVRHGLPHRMAVEK